VEDNDEEKGLEEHYRVLALGEKLKKLN